MPVSKKEEKPCFSLNILGTWIIIHSGMARWMRRTQWVSHPGLGKTRLYLDVPSGYVKIAIENGH